jgi:hypothetical protein
MQFNNFSKTNSNFISKQDIRRWAPMSWRADVRMASRATN